MRSGPPGSRPPTRSGPPTRREDSTEVSPSRLEAAKALYAIEKGSKVSDVLDTQKNLKPEDMALLRELVYGSTRQKRLLDYYLGTLCQTPFPKLPVEVKIALRLGLYQLLFLDRVPARAAVHESVNLAKTGGQENLSGFVNAVLRNAETNKAGFEPKGESDIDTLALKYSHPTWIVKKWVEKLDPEALENVLKANNSPHPVYLHTKPGEREKVIEDLAKQNIRVGGEPWPLQTLRLESHEGGLFSGESFQQGDWVVQDWVPQAMLELLNLAPGQKVWDVCAAPGGKTAGLAWKVGEQGQVMASDVSSERRKKLVENMNRLGLKQATVLEGTVEKLTPAQKFDLIWVDAPCSGTGVLSRRADLRWKLIPKEILSHAEAQKNLLFEVQGHLYPKGLLVYSTCSLEKEENEQVIQAFLKAYPQYRAKPMVLPEGLSQVVPCPEGLIFWPTKDHDGGFLSVLTVETDSVS